MRKPLLPQLLQNLPQSSPVAAPVSSVGRQLQHEAHWDLPQAIKHGIQIIPGDVIGQELLKNMTRRSDAMHRLGGADSFLGGEASKLVKPFVRVVAPNALLDIAWKWFCYQKFTKLTGKNNSHA